MEMNAGYTRRECLTLLARKCEARGVRGDDECGARQGVHERTLGLRLLRDEPYALVFGSNGTPLRIQKVEKVQRRLA